MSGYRLILTLALCVCVMGLSWPPPDPAWAKGSSDSKFKEYDSKGSKNSSKKGGEKKASKAVANLQVKRIWLDSKCRLNFQLKNGGKGKLSSSEHKRMGVKVSQGKKGTGFGLSKVDPKGALAKPGGVASYNTGLVIKGSVKVKVAVSKAPGETQTKDNQKSQTLVSRCVVKVKKKSGTDTGKKTSTKTLGATSSMKAKSAVPATGATKSSKKAQAALTLADLKLKDNRIQVVIRNAGKGKLNSSTAMHGRLKVKSASHNRTWSLLQLDPTRSKLSRSKKELVFDTKLVLKKSELVRAELLKVPGKNLKKQKRLTPSLAKSAKTVQGAAMAGAAASTMSMSSAERIKKKAAAEKARTMRMASKTDGVKSGKFLKEQTIRQPDKGRLMILGLTTAVAIYEKPDAGSTYATGDFVTARYYIRDHITEAQEYHIILVHRDTLMEFGRQTDYFSPPSDGEPVLRSTHFQIPSDAPPGEYVISVGIDEDHGASHPFTVGAGADLDMTIHRRDIRIIAPNGGVMNLCGERAFRATWQVHGDLLSDHTVDFKLKMGEVVVASWDGVSGTSAGDNQFTARLDLPEDTPLAHNYRLHAEMRGGGLTLSDVSTEGAHTISGPTDRSDADITIMGGIEVLDNPVSVFATRRANIRWRTNCPIERVNIHLMRSGERVYTIKSNHPASGGYGSSFSYTEYLYGANARRGTEGGFGYNPASGDTIGNHFYFMVENVDQPLMAGVSRPFSVSVPPISVTASNMGPDRDHTIRVRLNWSAPNVNPNLVVNMYAEVISEANVPPAPTNCRGHHVTHAYNTDYPPNHEMTWAPSEGTVQCLPWLTFNYIKVKYWEDLVSGYSSGLRLEDETGL